MSADANWSVFVDDGGWAHRDDGPAVVRPNGIREWFRHGLRHREDGPAVEGLIVDDEFWLNGRRVQSNEIGRIRFVDVEEEL